MQFRRFVSGGLSHHSYLLGDGGEAVVIDPRRDIDVYLRSARERGDRIRYILETHRNEDYAIGSTALAAATGAEILHSRGLPFEYGTPVGDGETVRVGRLRFQVLETPGHSPESLTFALADSAASSAPVIAFTGDALFVGDTGRIDLLGPDRAPHMAALLHESLQQKILPLGDGVVLCPAHGGGSVCGGQISDREISSLGFERLHNPSLDRDRERFVARKLAEEHARPPYFLRMEEWNLRGNAPIHERLPVPPPLAPGEIAEAMQDGALLIDARMPQAFAGGHIPGSLNLWAEGLSSYLGWMVPVGAPFALVLPEESSVEEIARRLFRIGYEQAVGYLRGGFEAWQNEGREVARLGTLDTNALRERLRRGDEIQVVDVRRPSEWAGGTAPGAKQIFLGDLEARAGELDRERPVVAMCRVGHRGGVAASLLARLGFREVFNYLGGFAAWRRRP